MATHLSWSVGNVRITRVLELEQVIPYNKEIPFLKDATPEALAEIPGMCPNYVTPEGALRLSFHTFLIETPTHRVMVDTCVGNDRSRAFITEEPLQTAFLEEIKGLGWQPESVDAVLCTHMHVDHVGWNTRLVDGRFVPTFPNATYYFSKEEYEHFSSVLEEGENAVINEDSIRPVLDAGLARFVETDYRLSPNLCLIPTPGHTPGHVSVVIESEGERAVISGDAIHHPSQFSKPEWMTAWEHDKEVALNTRLKLLSDMADSQDLLLGTHFPEPTGGYVVRDGNRYTFKTD